MDPFMDCLMENYLIHKENLPNVYFYYSYFAPKFSNRDFLELLLLAADRKINNIYQPKLKPGARN